MQEKEKQILEMIFGKTHSSPWKCNWRECAHGMGLAGREKCHGDPLDENCSEFITDEKFHERMKKSVKREENWKKETLL